MLARTASANSCKRKAEPLLDEMHDVLKAKRQATLTARLAATFAEQTAILAALAMLDGTGTKEAETTALAAHALTEEKQEAAQDAERAALMAFLT
jgi:hypothetical protein